MDSAHEVSRLLQFCGVVWIVGFLCLAPGKLLQKLAMLWFGLLGAVMARPLMAADLSRPIGEIGFAYIGQLGMFLMCAVGFSKAAYRSGLLHFDGAAT